MAAIKKSIRAVSAGSAREWKLQLRSGASLKGGASQAKVYSPNRLNYRFRAINSFKARPVTIALKSLSASGSPLSWKSENLAGRSVLGSQIVVFNDQDLRTIMPNLISGGFAINNSGDLPAANLFVVRKGSIVAKLKGPFQQQNLSWLRTALRADFVYRGGVNSIFSSSAESRRSVTSLKSWLLQPSARQAASLYIMRGSQLFPMSKSFMRTDQQLKRFVGSDAPYLFSSKVDIISYK